MLIVSCVFRHPSLHTVHLTAHVQKASRKTAAKHMKTKGAKRREKKKKMEKKLERGRKANSCSHCYRKWIPSSLWQRLAAATYNQQQVQRRLRHLLGRVRLMSIKTVQRVIFPPLYWSVFLYPIEVGNAYGSFWSQLWILFLYSTEAETSII